MSRSARKVLAFDFGASSGRAMLGIFDGGKIALEEIHRFSNDPVKVNGRYRWDALRLCYEILEGMRKCAAAGHADVSSIGIDTWGVDGVLLDRSGEMLANPCHYRNFTKDDMDRILDRLGREKVYRRTGIQFLPFNTLFQLALMREREPRLLDSAARFLMMPDFFNLFICGEAANEFTNASTTALLDTSHKWDRGLLDEIGVSPSLFSDPVPPGTVIGRLTADVAAETGLQRIPVVCVASHDTGSAVAAVPFPEGERGVYISSGTWSLMGTELDSPDVSDAAFAANFTNEGGVGYTTRFLKNIMGLWLIQESRRQWRREGRDYSFDYLENAAAGAAPFASLIDPDDPRLSPAGDIPSRIVEICRENGSAVPGGAGEISRCIYESLAFKYRYTAETIEKLQGRRVDTINIAGGGIKDRLLCRMTATLTGRRVLAGPVEATALGNVAVQLMALGELEGLRDIRRVSAASSDIAVYEPEKVPNVEEAYERFVLRAVGAKQ